MTPVYIIRDFSFNYPSSNYKIGFSGQLVINRGDHILLQGISGSGKSTLLLALKGIIPHVINGIVSGEIFYNGLSISSLNEQDLLTIGYLQQNPDSQLVCHSVFAELAFGLENLSLSKLEIETRINTIATDFQICHLLNRNVHQLSGGEKQKINLIAILLMQPEVLLLDEPTAFLDPESATELMVVLKKYTTDMTVIIVEHNLCYLQPIVNRVIRIDEDGSIGEPDINTVNWQPQLFVSSRQRLNNPPEVLTLKNLHFAYQSEKQLLKDINLTVRQGDIIAIHGKNGSGKSSLLKLIAKIIPKHSSIYWQQEDIAKLNTKQYWQHISLLWQNPESHFIFNSVSEEVNHQQDKLVEFNLLPQAKNNPFNLSEGQKRRLSLAITLNKSTQLFLLDEPSFGQDETNKIILINTIQQLAQSHGTFIIITHDLEFSNAVADHVYTLKDGQLWVN